MKNLISERLAIYGLLSILSSVLIFHFLVILNIIPYQIVWGGRIKTNTEMVQFESVSIIVNSVFLLVVLMRANILKLGNHPVKIRVILWLMVILFFLNTIGNLFAVTNLEKLLFTPFTAISCMFSLRLALRQSR